MTQHVTQQRANFWVPAQAARVLLRELGIWETRLQPLRLVAAQRKLVVVRQHANLAEKEHVWWVFCGRQQCESKQHTHKKNKTTPTTWPWLIM